MRFVAISGSLRAESTNTALLEATALLAPAHIQIVLYRELGDIPPFNPDLDVDPAPDPVSRFRAELRESDAVLFSTPEYAHGVPGSLKNSLDWVVGSGELSGKPVVLINASARGAFAQASLRETLRTMNARLLSDAEATVPILRPCDASALAANWELATLIRSFLKNVGNSL